MKSKLLLPLALLTASASVFAQGADSATTTLHWKGIVPSVIAGDQVIITGLGGSLPYADSAGLTVADNTGVFTSDQINLELHYRACSDGTTAGSCPEGGVVEGETAAAVGDVIPTATWTMNTLDTVVGTQDTNELDTHVFMDGTAMVQGTGVTATGGTVTFTTENTQAASTPLAIGQNIEVHTVINSSTAI